MDQRVSNKDQRVSSERRQDSAPLREAKAAGSKEASWLMRRRRALALTMAALGVLAIAGLAMWWTLAGDSLSTDDAFITARTVTISPQISAQVVDVPVTDNRMVAAGTVLVRLDDSDAKAQVDQAKAQVDAAQANITNIEAQIAAQQSRIVEADKQVSQADAALAFATQQNNRYQGLLQQGAVTAEQAQQYHSGYLQAQASLAAAQASAAATKKQLPVLQSQKLQAQAEVEQRQAALEQAQITLSRTVVTAPVDGYVTQLTAAKGNYAAAGQALMMFVPRDMWVTANFKETELSAIRPGAPVTIRVDAFPGRTFAGHVESIQAGSGTAFSLLPPENATGNYVKIVQRVPVKIVFNAPPDVLLGPGMSVVPSVKVR